MERTLMLVRHGESEANRAGTFDGYANAGLTELGGRQARRAGARLGAFAPRPVRLLSSPLVRAAHTAEQIGKRLAAEVFFDRRLLAGEGRPGQSLDRAGDEVAEAIAEAWADWDGTLIAVSHRFPIRAYLQLLYGAARAISLVDALGNGDALEVRFNADAVRDAVHHQWQDDSTEPKSS